MGIVKLRWLKAETCVVLFCNHEEHIALASQLQASVERYVPPVMLKILNV